MTHLFILWRENESYGVYDSLPDAQEGLESEIGNHPECKCYDEFRIEEVQVINTWSVGIKKKDVVKTVYVLDFQKEKTND